jgi:hypothetical protein
LLGKSKHVIDVTVLVDEIYLSRAVRVEYQFSQQHASHDLCHNKVEQVTTTPKSDQSVTGSIER